MNGQRTTYWIEYRKRRAKAVVHADRCSERGRTEGAREYSSLAHAMHDAVIATSIEVHGCCPKKPGLWLWAWRIKNNVREIILRRDRVTKAEGKRRCDSCFRIEAIVCSVLVGESNRVNFCEYCRKTLFEGNAFKVEPGASRPYIEVPGGLPGSKRGH
jgi:hypothetical protein